MGTESAARCLAETSMLWGMGFSGSGFRADHGLLMGLLIIGNNYGFLRLIGPFRFGVVQIGPGHDSPTSLEFRGDCLFWQLALGFRSFLQDLRSCKSASWCPDSGRRTVKASITC